MNNNYYAILMAGGVGSRFWPVSTKSFPKQFHDMLGTGDTLIQRTFHRLSKFIPSQNILILTNKDYKDLVFEQLPMLQEEQVVLEPAMRNTAPCILYASLKIKKKNENALILVAPSDHWIEDEDAFMSDIITVFDYCNNKNALMTLGINPTFPNTGYGYIEYNKEDDSDIKEVKQFREKPDYDTAKTFLQQGNFLWNAGIFAWSAKSLITAFQNHCPDLYNHLNKGLEFYNTDKEDDFIKKEYPSSENISIDYAIMEASDNVFVLPANFDWNDLGAWGSLYDKLESDSNNNVIVNAQTLAIESTGNLIRTQSDKLVVLDGLKDYIIVDKDEVLLIFPKDKEQDIKETLNKVRETFGEQYT